MSKSLPRTWGSHVLLEELGAGATARVYRARPLSGGGEVALKVLKSSRAFDPKQRERFQREAETVARLRHPGILGIHGVGETEGTPWIAYRLVYPAETLDCAMPAMPHAERIRTITDVTAAVAHAHEHGVVHRDLKPENVLLHEGRSLVSDFGLAWFDGAETLTKTGGVAGTPQYMPPEVLNGGQRGRAAADVWALGTMLYEAMTGRLPFQAGSYFELATAMTTRPPSPHSLDPALSLARSNVCMKALEPDPGLRYRDAAELLEDLRRCERGEAPEARVPAGPRPGSPVALALVVIGGLGAAALGVYALRLPAPAPTASVSRTASTPEQQPQDDPRLESLRRYAEVLRQGDLVALGPIAHRLKPTSRTPKPIADPSVLPLLGRTLEQLRAEAAGARWSRAHRDVLVAWAQSGLRAPPEAADRLLDALYQEWWVTKSLPAADYAEALHALVRLDALPLFENIVLLKRELKRRAERSPIDGYLLRLWEVYELGLEAGSYAEPPRTPRQGTPADLGPRNQALNEALDGASVDAERRRLRLQAACDRDPTNPWSAVALATVRLRLREADSAAAGALRAASLLQPFEQRRGTVLGNLRIQTYGWCMDVLVRAGRRPEAQRMAHGLDRLTDWERKQLVKYCRRMRLEPPP